MRERDDLREACIDAQGTCQRGRPMGDLQRMGQPSPEVIAFVRDKDLCLVLQTAERRAVNDPMPIQFEPAAEGNRRFVMDAAATPRGVNGIGREFGGRVVHGPVARPSWGRRISRETSHNRL